MLLNELKVEKTWRASQANITNYIEMYGHRAQDAKEIKTSDPNLTLAVWKSNKDRLFIVFPVISEDEDEVFAGFVEFTWPDKLGQRKPWSPNVRTPHSGLYTEYQGKGIAKMIYRWFLDAGNILVTADLQTPESNALWRSLSRDYEVVFFDDRGQFIDNPTPKQALAKNVRMALLGKGQTRDNIFKS